MLEFRITADAKRIASMCDAIRRECEGARVGNEHADAVVRIVEQLVAQDEAEPGRTGGGRRRRPVEALVIVTVQSDATMVMVREPRPAQTALGERRRRLLDESTVRWSTISGRDGRTTWAEIVRPQPVRADARRYEMTAGSPVRAVPPVVTSA
ncbi:MAG TPA: hypothetical protein VGP92_07045 [Acidimicrobiia bacterium]|nr:hypothetical protein [Acidimicrobiia bacterium]